MIATKQLLLRQWKEEDFKPFACLNADACVMEYFPAVLTQEESNQITSLCSVFIGTEHFNFNSDSKSINSIT